MAVKNNNSGNVVKDGNVQKIFPYKILNDLSSKLRSAEAQIVRDKQFYEAKIAEYEVKLEDYTRQNHLASSDGCEQVSLQSNRSEHAMPTDSIDDSKNGLNLVIKQLRQQVANLVYENNRYHLQLSNCQFCTSDTSFTEDSTTLDESISVSTAVTIPSSISPPTKSAMSSSVQALRSSSAQNVKNKDQAFITRMVKASCKLEVKYSTPPHKRKKNFFARKKRQSHVIPCEFSAIYHQLAAPEPELVSVPEPYPQVQWKSIWFKPVLPNPEPCPIFSCSQDPKFYQDHIPQCPCPDDPIIRAKFIKKDPFGTLPGYQTNAGVVAVPSTAVGGYVYCPDAQKWLLYATSGSIVSRGEKRGLTFMKRKG